MTTRRICQAIGSAIIGAATGAFVWQAATATGEPMAGRVGVALLALGLGTALGVLVWRPESFR